MVSGEALALQLINPAKGKIDELGAGTLATACGQEASVPLGDVHVPGERSLVFASHRFKKGIFGN